MVQSVGCRLAAVRRYGGTPSITTACIAVPVHSAAVLQLDHRGQRQTVFGTAHRASLRPSPMAPDCLKTMLRVQAGAAAMLSLGGAGGAALANELDILNLPAPGTQHVIDDAGVLNKTTRKGLNDELSRLGGMHLCKDLRRHAESALVGLSRFPCAWSSRQRTD